MTQEEKLDALLNAMRTKPHKGWTITDLGAVLPLQVSTEMGRLFSTLVTRKFVIHASAEYTLTSEGEIFEGFVSEKHRRLQYNKDMQESKRTASVTLRWTKINTWFVIISVIIAITALILAIIK